MLRLPAIPDQPTPETGGKYQTKTKETKTKQNTPCALGIWHVMYIQTFQSVPLITNSQHPSLLHPRSTNKQMKFARLKQNQLVPRELVKTLRLAQRVGTALHLEVDQGGATGRLAVQPALATVAIIIRAVALGLLPLPARPPAATRPARRSVAGRCGPRTSRASWSVSLLWCLNG